MQIRKLHIEEPDIDVALVRRLLSSQMPQWANLPLRLVESIGTDNVMIRLGDLLVIRMPRTPGAAEGITKGATVGATSGPVPTGPRARSSRSG